MIHVVHFDVAFTYDRHLFHGAQYLWASQSPTQLQASPFALTSIGGPDFKALRGKNLRAKVGNHSPSLVSNPSLHAFFLGTNKQPRIRHSQITLFSFFFF